MKTFRPITGHLAENADGNRQHPTEGEKNFIRFCERMSIPYEYQVPIYCDGKGYILDFELTYEYSTKKNVRKVRYVVEIDGEYHHVPVQQQKDTKRTKDLLQAGYKKVIRLKNEDTWTDYTIFNELYSQIPKENKAGALYAAYLKGKYNRMVQGWSKPVATENKEVAYLNKRIMELVEENRKLKEENKTLKDVSEVLAEETYKVQKERDYWKGKTTELDRNLWTLSASTGNFIYYCTKDRKVEHDAYLPF